MRSLRISENVLNITNFSVRVVATMIFFFGLGNASYGSVLEGLVTLEDGSPAVQAHVAFENTTYQAVTGLEGEFRLADIQPGSYQLKVTYIGYEPYIQQITLAKNEKANVRIQLSSTSLELNDLLIVGKSEATEIAEDPMLIETVELKLLETQIKDMGEAVDQLSGVRVRTSGSLGDRLDIAINGLNGTAVRTYIDGIPQEFAYPDLTVANIPMTNVKRLDVYKGVVPIDVGTDAMGGAINIVTDFKYDNNIRASYSYGSFNTHQASVNANIAVKEDIVVNINGSYNYSDNDYEMKATVLEPTEFGVNDLGERVVRRFHDAYELQFVDASLMIRNKGWADIFRVNVNYTDYFKEAQNGNQVEQVAIGETVFSGNNATALINYEKVFNKLTLNTTSILSRNNTFSDDASFNEYSWTGEILRTNTELRAEYDRAAGPVISSKNINNYVNRLSLTYSLTDQDELLFSNLVANQKSTGRNELEPIATDFLTKPQRLTKDVLGLRYKKRLFEDKFSISLAGKTYLFWVEGVNQNESFTRFTTSDVFFGWYGSLKYNLQDDFFIRASYEKAYRIPTFFQFFGNGNIIAPSIGLKPELSNNYNVGISYKSYKPDTKYGLEVNGFLRGQEDVIFLQPGEAVQRYINAEEIKTMGVEGEVFVDFWSHFKVTLNVTNFSKTFESVSDDFAGSVSGIEGTNFPNTPNFFVNNRMAYRTENLIRQKDHFNVYLQYKFVDEFNFNYESGQVDKDEFFVPTQHRLDAGFSYAPDEQMKVAFNVYNLTDDELFDNFRIPRPGRNYNIKVIYQINKF